MIHDYDEKKGYISLWIGKFKNSDAINDYLSTKYFDEESENESELWEKLFIPENKSRTCEKELIEYFDYEFFNQFEYDFGLTFDEDFCETNFLKHETADLKILFNDFSYSDSFINKIKNLNFDMNKRYNTAVILYDFKYEGDIKSIQGDDFYLYFLGYLKI